MRALAIVCLVACGNASEPSGGQPEVPEESVPAPGAPLEAPPDPPGDRHEDYGVDRGPDLRPEGRPPGYGSGASNRALRVLRVENGPAQLRGGLSRDVVDPIVRRHINEIRFCYEQSLNERPGLAGRVVVDFVIAANGQVASADVASSTLGEERAEGCIVTVVQRWRFPAPTSGSVVRVRYPFVLSIAD